MDEGIEEGVGSMAAVMKLSKEKVDTLLEEASKFGVVEVANLYHLVLNMVYLIHLNTLLF